MRLLSHAFAPLQETNSAINSHKQKRIYKRKIMFIDTHAHLTDEAFKGEEDEIIKLSKEMGVSGIINSGFDIPSSLQVISLAEKYPGLYASVGIYPENIKELDDENYKKLFELAQHKKVVAIGEIGLQYTEGCADRNKQKEGFLRQLKLAYELKKPIVIHCREAYGDMIDLLKKNSQLLAYGGTFHCFSGSEEIAKDAIKLGLYISVGGVSTFKNAEKLRRVIEGVPLERILLETDCPYLSPHPFRGKRNSPEYIPTIAENLAKLKGVSIEEVAIKTSRNAKILFNLN